jgi:hypothetical protein
LRAVTFRELLKRVEFNIRNRSLCVLGTGTKTSSGSLDPGATKAEVVGWNHVRTQTLTHMKDLAAVDAEFGRA